LSSLGKDHVRSKTFISNKILEQVSALTILAGYVIKNIKFVQVIITLSIQTFVSAKAVDLTLLNFGKTYDGIWKWGLDN
jgi:hypothetical protein